MAKSRQLLICRQPSPPPWTMTRIRGSGSSLSLMGSPTTLFTAILRQDSDTRLKWLAKRPGKRRLKNGEMADIPFSPLPYEQAAKVLFDMGQDNDARKILLEKERLANGRRADSTGGTKTLARVVGRISRDTATNGEWTHRIGSLAICLIGWRAVIFVHTNDYGRMAPHQPAIIASEEFQDYVPKCAPGVSATRWFFRRMCSFRYSPASGAVLVSCCRKRKCSRVACSKGKKLSGWTIGGVIMVIFLGWMCSFRKNFY